MVQLDKLCETHKKEVDMKASRKDFKAIAQSLRDLKANMQAAESDNAYAMAFRGHVMELCVIFKRANPAFDKQKFKDAIGE